MAFLKHANNAVSSISTAGGISNGATSVSIQLGDTGLFPSSGNFEVTLWPAGSNPTAANSEIALVTAGQGTQTFTITRAQETTTAKNFNQGDNIALLITAKQLTDIEAALSGGSQGSVPYYNSTGTLTPLTPGTNGQVLETQGPGQNPIWSTPSSASAWTPDLNTWVYASATTFTIAGNFTSIYTKGTRLQWTDSGGTKYGVVYTSTFSNPNTTVTVIPTSDYNFINATITNNSYSYQINPPGFPGWFNFSTTWGGFSSNPTATFRWMAIGNQLFIHQIPGSGGTSNSSALTFTVPVAPTVGITNASVIYVIDNGSNQSAPGHLEFTSSITTVNAWKTFYEGGFTASGTKGVYCPTFSFEI